MRYLLRNIFKKHLQICLIGIIGKPFTNIAKVAFRNGTRGNL